MRFANNYLLLRHGEAKSNKYQFVSCLPEKIYNPLTRYGRARIKKLIPIFKKEKVDLIFSSPVLRTKQSAEIIAKELRLKIIFDKELRETEFGRFNGKPAAEWKLFFAKIRNKTSAKHYGMENYKDVSRRARKFLEKIEKKYKNKNILIISHGAVLFSLEAALRNIPPKKERAYENLLKFETGELKKIE